MKAICQTLQIDILFRLTRLLQYDHFTDKNNILIRVTDRQDLGFKEIKLCSIAFFSAKIYEQVPLLITRVLILEWQN